MIQIKVSNEFKNDKLLLILQQNNTSINETILNYGFNLYENQAYIIKNYSIDNELKIKNNELQNLQNQIIDNTKKYELSILSLQNDKDKLIQNKDYEIKHIENKIKQQYDYIITNLENDINKLHSQKTLEITSLIDKGKDITKNEYDKYILLHEKYNIDLKLNYENQIKELHSKLDDLYQKNNILTNKLFDINNNNQNYKYDTLINNINTLNNKLNDNFDKFYKGNTEKGIMGENFIESFLTTYFTNCKIIDTHKQTAKGDILFIFDKVKTLIESKNVQTLKKEDIDKFYRDVELTASKNEINSAILISLNDTNLAYGKRLFHFEIKYNIPIIMISNVFKNQEYIRFSISIFNYLIKNGINNYQHKDYNIIPIINTINDIYITFKSQINYLNSDKQIIEKLYESIKKRQNELLNIDTLFKNIFSKLPITYTTQTTHSTQATQATLSTHYNHEQLLNIIINKIKTHPHYSNKNYNFKINIKNLLSIGISKNDIKHSGGIKNIQEAFTDILVV